MKSFIYIIFCSTFFISCESKVSERPNIIFIMSDDHSEAAISAYGSNLISTPNIDRIANDCLLYTSPSPRDRG